MNNLILPRLDTGRGRPTYGTDTARFVVVQTEGQAARGNYTLDQETGLFVGQLDSTPDQLTVLARFDAANKRGARQAFLQLTSGSMLSKRMQAEGGGVAGTSPGQPLPESTSIDVGDEWMTVAEYAKAAGVTPRAIYERIERKVLPTKRIPPRNGMLFIDSKTYPPERWRESSK